MQDNDGPWWGFIIYVLTIIIIVETCILIWR